MFEYLIFIIIIMFFLCLSFFGKFLLELKDIKIITIYFISVFLELICFFWFYIWNFFYWMFQIITQKGEVIIILGDGQELLFLMVKISIFFCSLCAIPFYFFYFYFFSKNFWTLQEKNKYKYLFLLLIYLYIIMLWIFVQDLGFSVWEIIIIKEQEKNIFWTLMDYQPQIENIFRHLKNEFIDFLNWVFYLFLIVSFFLLTKFFSVSRCFFKVFVQIFGLFGCYFFFGGDGLSTDIFIILFSIINVELLIFTFYFFLRLKQKNM